MLIAQMSDLHLRADGSPLRKSIDTIAATARAIAHVQALDPPPDVLLATGDLADHGRTRDYEMLRGMLAELPMPVFLIPGNHDNRNPLRHVFGGTPMLPTDGEFLHYVVDARPVRMIGLDTVIPGEIGGGLCAERLSWLEQRLGEAREQPTLIFMHHPPFASGIRFLDTPFSGCGGLEALLHRHRQVRLVICGHIHRAISRCWAGTAAAVAPSTVYQMNLALNPGEVYRDVPDPPAIALYLWEDGADPIVYTSLIGAEAPREAE